MQMAEYGPKELEFFGKITASATHEMKNVLAIIKESSGLMEDLIALSPEMPIQLREKCQRTLSVITNQIKRGADVSDRLNRFAHSTDFPTGSIELHASALQIINLAKRFALLKNVALEIDPPEAAMTVTTHPVLLLRTLFGIIECCLNMLPQGSQILIGVKKAGDGFAVSFICKGNDSIPVDLSQTLSTENAWFDLKQMAATLGGTLEWDASGLCIRLYLQGSAV